MEEKNLKEMRGSEIHRMMAAILEVMEKAQFEPQVDLSIREAADSSTWMMAFQKKATNLDELSGIKAELGGHFTVRIEPRDKGSVTVVLEAPATDFIGLLKEK